jgi:REP element-mobilizing transposase RayT
MTRPIRDRNQEHLHLVIVRTEATRYHLRPSKDIKRIVAGVITRYQEIFGITIYAYVIMPNHIPVLLEDPRDNLNEFMENVNKLGRVFKYSKLLR